MWVIFAVVLLLISFSVAFQARIGHIPYGGVKLLFMRDGSTASTYFDVGDKVRIVMDVWHKPQTQAPFSSKDLEGVILSVWQKCEVDPSCCCAELAFDAPIEVQFQGNQYDANARTWTAHFALNEIQRIIGNEDSI